MFANQDHDPFDPLLHDLDLTRQRSSLRSSPLLVRDEQCRALVCPPGQSFIRLTVGYGVVLFCKNTGHKAWRFLYRKGGVQLGVTLGRYPVLPLEGARAMGLDLMRRMASDPYFDPASRRKVERAEAQARKDARAQARRDARAKKAAEAAEAALPTFEQAAEVWIAHKVARNDWTAMSEQDRALWRVGKRPKVRTLSTELKARGRLRKHVFPAIGGLQMHRIERADVLSMIAAIKAPGEAGKAFEFTRGVFDLWLLSQPAGTPNPTDGISRARVLPRVRNSNFDAITDPVAFGKMVADVRAGGCRHVSAASLPLFLSQVYLFQRAGALVQMRWADIRRQGELDVWWCPRDSMKYPAAAKLAFRKSRLANPDDSKNYHMVPLPRQVMALLDSLRPFTGEGEYVFAARGIKKEESLSTACLMQMLKRAGYSGKQTVHGLRASVKTILRDHFKLDSALIEKHMDHVLPEDKYQGAYDRADFLQKRALLVQGWADIVDLLAAGSPLSDFKGFPSILESAKGA